MRTIGDSTSDTSALSVTSEPETIRVIENTTDGRAIVVDDPAVLFLGDYSRQGNDLLIEHEGESHLIADYFGSATPANLAAPNGAFLEADLVSTLAGDPFGGQYAQAGGGNAAQIGKVIKLEGAATSTSADGTKTPLAIDTPVYQGDVIETGAGSKLGISFVDKTVFSMSADARMVLDELIFDPANVGNSSMNFNLVQGAFVFVTGDIAPTGNMKIDTPVATMGIRGTTPRVVINTDLGVSEFTILPDPDTGKIGSYVIINKETGAILGTVRSTADKWVVTSLSNEAVKINKTGLDLLEDQVALDEIQDVFSRSLGDRAEIDGANSFQRIGFDATASDDGDGPEDGGAGDDPNGDGGVLADGSNNDDPPVASDDEFATDDNTTISTGLNVVVNDNNNGVDIDPEGFPINVSQINGQDLVFVGSVASVPLPSGAILLIESDGDITYSPNGAYDFLGLNDVDQDIFEYTIVDDGGQTDIGTITVTLTGRNEQPVVTNVDISGFSDSFTENADTGNNTNIRMAFGEVEFADTDASDTHTPSAGAPDVVWTQGSGAEVDLGPIGSIALTLTETSADPAPVLTFNPGPPPVLTSRPAPVEGDVAWQYSVAEADIDFLALGETLTLIYPITITDDSGVGGGNSGDEPDSVTQNVVITITGTNDAPQIGVLTDVDHTFTDGSALLSTSGSFGVIDVDVTDVVSITDVSVVTAGQDTDAQGADLSNAELLDLFVPRSGVEVINGETTGTVSWDFNAAANTFDYLALGETLTLTYTITLTDDNGANSLSETQDVVITIEGTNQEPIITVNNPDDVAETFVDGSALLSTDGSFIVSDVDTTDIITIAGITVLTDGQDVDAQNAHLSTAGLLDLFSPRSGVEIPNNDNEGVVEWTFNADAQTFDYLALGETLTVTYRVETLTDDNGPDSLTAIQDIVITIEGTNQQPQITVNNPADVAETFTDGSVLLATNGSFDVSDVDTTDVVTISGVTVATVGQDSDAQGAALDDTALLALFTPKTGVEVTGTDNAGTVTWDFTAAAQTFDYLALGETLTLTYTVTLTDDNGASSLTNTQDVTITIEGTNQQPVISLVGTDSATSALTEGIAPLTDSGTISVSDADTTDTVSVALDGVTVGGTGAGVNPLTTAALEGFFSVGPVPVVGTAGNEGDIAWSFDSGSEIFDFLAKDETLELTYKVDVSDGNGGTATTDVVVTITGTNDAPTGLTPAFNYTLTEDTGIVSGNLGVSVAFSGADAPQDVDASDILSGNVSYNNDATWSGGTLSAAQIAALTAQISVVSANQWDYKVANADVQFLKAGETITLSFGFNATDDSGAANNSTQTQTVTITIQGTGETPVISSSTSAFTYVEGDGARAIDSTISLSDVDSTTLTGATVTIGTGFQAGTDTLEFVNQNGISGILINNVLTLSGTANVADYEAALQSVAFQVEPGALTPLNATREFSFSVTDDAGLGSNVTTVTAAVSNANIINGTPGNDQGTASLYGTGANDRIRGFAGNDEIEGQGGNDIIDGGTGSDIIGGGAGDDIIFTDGDFNDIAGGPGNDYLLAVGNFNNLEGGSGNDEFQILAGSLGTTIADYTEGEDVINLETLLGPSSGFDPNDPTSTISVESDGLNPATLAVDGQNLAMLESVSPGEFISIIYDSSQAAIQVEVQFGSGGGPS